MTTANSWPYMPKEAVHQPGSYLSKLGSKDIFSRPQSRGKLSSNNITCILPAQLALGNAIEGEIGLIDMSDMNHPIMTIPVENGKLKFYGSYIKSSNKFLSLHLSSSQKKSVCDVVDTFLVFDEPIFETSKSNDVKVHVYQEGKDRLTTYHGLSNLADPVRKLKKERRKSDGKISRPSNSSSAGKRKRESKNESSSEEDIESDFISDGSNDEFSMNSEPTPPISRSRPSRASLKPIVYKVDDSDDSVMDNSSSVESDESCSSLENKLNSKKPKTDDRCTKSIVTGIVTVSKPSNSAKKATPKVGARSNAISAKTLKGSSRSAEKKIPESDTSDRDVDDDSSFSSASVSIVDQSTIRSRPRRTSSVTYIEIDSDD